MQNTIDSLSNQEFEIYDHTVMLEKIGDQVDIGKQLEKDGTFERYRKIHQNYLDLFLDSKDEKTKLEILKRLIFLNWYGIIEPSYYSGIGILDDEIISKSYTILNDYLINNKIDSELKWMLSYYSSWDFSILPYSEPNLKALTKFVKERDDSVLASPEKELPKGTMDNRGQMGIYWKISTIKED
ncbi:hypothetical protein [Pedobacter sp. UBA5917]|jgi:hypothetical protein|uniref:hypothetical protein n=1 Tax=Pedobacter sp. UBA5917 TaxID=1947061 RepID=UPI0025E8CE17|nr:hypothetical protein [Pedobacter sp. UBA5917]